MKKRNKHRNRPKSLQQMIIRLPATTDFDAMPEELQADLRSVRIQLGGIVVGSQPYYGKVIIIILTYLSKGDMTSLFAKHDLSWSVLAVEGLPLNQTQILKFISDVDTYGEEGNVTGSEPVTDISGKLQVFSGHNWAY